MSEARTLEGSCHCGAVRFTVETDLASVNVCNCSHCRRKGFMLAFVPEAQFTLLSGGDAQTEYRFNSKKIEHLFCKTCGVQSFGRGPGPEGASMMAVNLRCVDGLDLDALSTTPVDGRSF